MLRVGITGGIASGKSFVASMFEALGIPVYYADREAKRLIATETDMIRDIRKLLGEKAYSEDGRYNTKYVAAIVFNDREKLMALNSIVHPRVKADYMSWHECQEAPYTLHESALIYEGGFSPLMDKIIVVTAPEDVRISRLMSRDHITEEQAIRKISSQMPEQEKVDMADFVIHNDGKRLLIDQVWAVHIRLKDQ